MSRLSSFSAMELQVIYDALIQYDSGKSTANKIFADDPMAIINALTGKDASGLGQWLQDTKTATEFVDHLKSKVLILRDKTQIAELE